MESKKCMNILCATPISTRWHKGWPLRSGAFALLCDSCGSAYEQSRFCDVFHSSDSGWRPCNLCGKHLHCGCIASRSLILLRDNGGITCINCTRNSGPEPISSTGVPYDGSGTSFILSKWEQALASLGEIGSSFITQSHWLPRSTLATASETNVFIATPIHVTERQGRNQLLPHHSPRITEEELQQISRNLRSNSTIVPLFEKMVTPSDVGRVGRLIVPKACAEAFFPLISQAQGIPLLVQDVNGIKWLFQFRFWPNNNSRIYVLEGVTPCFKAMRLEAGDTVTFSRIDPERKLMIGFRKGQPYSDTKALKENSKAHLKMLCEKFNAASGDMDCHDITMSKGSKREGLLPQKKKTCNSGSKGKGLLNDSQGALKMKLTREEAQDLLRPPPTVKPTIEVIEDIEFEEYQEPPILGKKGIFITRSNGISEQWTQCDSCSKWRKLPADILLPPKWTCAENIWDPSRSSCSAPEEMNPKELDDLMKMIKDF